jgi:hypothetical protein
MAIALLTRENVRNVGSFLKLVYRTENTDRFDDLLRALDKPLERFAR